ncbi:MAG: sugar phosphate isomerase/epimerase family protein [Candidatus Altiarchaeota archaeon]
MRVGSMNNPRNNVLEELTLFSGFGLDFIDLTIEAPEATPEKVGEAKSGLMKFLREKNMSLVAHMPWFLQIASPYPDLRDAFVGEAFRVLEAASLLRAWHVTIHPDFLTLHRPKSELLELTVSSLGLILERAGELGLELCFENFEKAHISTDAMGDIFRRLPELKFTLDVGHAFMGSHNMEHVRHLVGEFGDRLLHVHLHDNMGHHDDHLPLGVGKIDLSEVVSILKSSGFDNTITLEIHADDRDYIRVSMEKLRDAWEDN